MDGTGFFASILLPAAVAGVLYIALFFVAVPLWQRFHGRCSRYLPQHIRLPTFSLDISAVRERLHAAATRLILPSRWRQDYEAAQQPARAEREFMALDDEGGELYELDPSVQREADGAQLSRELEEGFGGSETNTDTSDESDTN